MKDELQQCLNYCLEQNGRPDCKNCGLDSEMIKRHDEQVRREERERIRKSFDHWFKKGTEDVEDWAERVIRLS